MKMNLVQCYIDQGGYACRSSDLYHHLEDRDMKRWLQFKTQKWFIQMHTYCQIGTKLCITQ